jgi:muramoyltetrapeptide carboxypeptidase
MTKIPPYLKAGEIIAITCPAGYMPSEKAASCIATLQNWGYEVLVGKTLGSNSQNYFSADDDTRIEELQAMLDDKSIKAILFGRGGYGISRIIDKLDFRKFKKHPKWLIGFSDITVMHMHLLRNYNIASMHAPMAAAFNDDPHGNEYIISLRDALEGRKAYYECAPHPFNIQGKAKGNLVGGNLALLAHVTGTDSDFDTKNRILFLEDIGEYIYNVDRMMYQLKRSGKFKKLAGLILGGFTDMKDTERAFGKTIDQVLKDMVSTWNCPVCFHFPVSHARENVTLKIGVTYELIVSAENTVLKEV